MKLSIKLALVTKEFQTKDGRALTFKTFEDIESGPRKFAWQVDQVIAYVGDLEVGDIRISNVPIERFEEVFPTIWHFIHDQTGVCISEDAYTDPIKLYKQAIVYFEDWNKWKDINSKEVSLEEAETSLNKWVNSPEIQKKLAEFKAVYIEKPYVSYIRVKGVRGYKEEDGNWGRQRIGAALYEYAARWLAERGRVLYASGLQSEEAKAAWAWMKSQGYPIKVDTNPLYDKPRFYLDYR